MNFFKRKNGFTLLEVLIATAIFTGVMIITTGVVIASMQYNAKIKTIRDTSEEANKLADQITRDIREADDSFTIAYTDDDHVTTKTLSFKSLALFGCGYGLSGCSNSTDMSVSDHPRNVIIVANKDKVKIYWFVTQNGKAVYYYEYDRSSLDNTTGKVFQTTWAAPKDLNQILGQSVTNSGGDPKFNLIAGSADTIGNANTSSMKTTVSIIDLYAPNTSLTSVRQPFVTFSILSEIGANADQPENHTKTALQTTVTLRSYSK